MKCERRTFKVEVRKSGDARKIGGTAVVFNQLSENLGGFREQIAPDAFDDCDMSDVRCLFNHDPNQVLGRTTSGTLSLSSSPAGVEFDCNPPDTSYARDLATSMDRGDIDQCSFSFSVAAGGSDWSEDSTTGATIRTVKKISRLFDVSVVTYPAYTQTSSELRSNAEILSEKPTAPPPASGGAGIDLLRRKLELAFLEVQQ